MLLVPCFFVGLKIKGDAMNSIKVIPAHQVPPTPAETANGVPLTSEVRWSERISGALFCSVEATMWIVQVGLMLALWMIKLVLMIGIAVISVGFGRRH